VVGDGWATAVDDQHTDEQRQDQRRTRGRRSSHKRHFCFACKSTRHRGSAFSAVSGKGCSSQRRTRGMPAMEDVGKHLCSHWERPAPRKAFRVSHPKDLTLVHSVTKSLCV